MNTGDIIWIDDVPQVDVINDVVRITAMSDSAAIPLAMAVNTLLHLIERARIAIDNWMDAGGQID